MRRGPWMAFAGILVGSPSSAFVRLVATNESAWQIVVLRSIPYLCTICAALVIRMCQLPPSRRSVAMDGSNILSAVAMAGQSIVIVVALLLTSVSTTVLVMQIAPLLCASVDHLVLKETVPARRLVLLVVGFVGVIVVVLTSAQAATNDADQRCQVCGTLVALINPLCWALVFFLSKRTRRGASSVPEDPLCRNLVMLLLAGVICAAIGILGAAAAWAGPAEPGLVTARRGAAEAWLWYLLYGGVCLPSTQYLLSAAVRHGSSSSEVAAIKTIEVVVGPLLVFLFVDPNEVPSIGTVCGGTIIVLAVLAFSADAERDARRAQLATSSVWKCVEVGHMDDRVPMARADSMHSTFAESPHLQRPSEMTLPEPSTRDATDFD